MGKNSKKAVLEEGTLKTLSKLIPDAISESHTLLSILKCFGIQSVYEHLGHPEVSPISCMKRASRSLKLMAFHGDKWLFEPWFEPELHRLHLRQGTVQFLISETIDIKTVERCRELLAKHPDVFAVRVFSENAIFRLVLIDDNLMLLGHYGYEVIEQDGNNAKGWKSPQLLIEDNKNWSFLIPFRELFKINWDRARDIKTLFGDNSSGVIKREFQPKKV